MSKSIPSTQSTLLMLLCFYQQEKELAEFNRRISQFEDVVANISARCDSLYGELALLGVENEILRSELATYKLLEGAA